MVNIFFLSRRPSEIPKQVLDCHVLSLYSEIILILDYCHKYYDGIQRFHQTSILARGVAVVLWVAKNSANYSWTCKLAEEVIKEYRYRFPNTYSTRYDKYYLWFFEHIPKKMPKSTKITPIQISHQNLFFHELTPDPIINSRYLYADLKEFSPSKDKYTNRLRPAWLINLREDIKKDKNKIIRVIDKWDDKSVGLYLNFAYYKFNMSWKKIFTNIIHRKLSYNELVNKKNKHHFFAYPILLKLIKIHRLIGITKELIEYSKDMKQDKKFDSLYAKLIPIIN